MDPRLIALGELLSVGWPLASSANLLGFTANCDHSSTGVLSPRQIASALSFRRARAREAPLHGFASIVLRAGSLSQAYRSVFFTEGLSPSAIRQRASRLVRLQPTQAALRSLVSLLEPVGGDPKGKSYIEEMRRVPLDEVNAAASLDGSGKSLHERATGIGKASEPKRCGARTRSKDRAPCKCKVVPG